MGAKVLSAEAVITRSYKVAGFRVSQAGNSDYSLKTSKPAFAGQGSLSRREEHRSVPPSVQIRSCVNLALFNRK